jgi:internalin A
MSNLAQQRIREAKEKRLTRLDIGNCGLTEIPEEVFELTWLEELILSSEWDEYSFEKMKWERFNSQDEGKANNIKTISPKIKLLRVLKKLIAGAHRIPKWDLNDLSPLQDSIALQVLNVDLTQVSDLNPLKDLTSLHALHISSTEVSDISPLKNLMQLQELILNSTPIIDLTPLKNLIKLQHLLVSRTKILTLAPLKDLIYIKRLYAAHNELNDLSPLEGLTELFELGISGSKVYDLSPLKNLTKLEVLRIDNTQASDLSPLTHLRALQEIDISKTQVSDLSPLKKSLENKMFLQAKRCPLNNPPIEIVEQGNEAILRYWKEQDRVGLKKVNEARLLLVGQGASGKTTLKDKLINRNAPMPAPDATTKGIEITPIICKNTEGDDFTVQVWDFGGQNIQKYAHQFFMSDSVVYAVLSNTREQNPNFQYWLNIIELLGKESPFFIVQNEKDGHKEPLKDITQIQERFPQTFQSALQVNLKAAATDPRFEILEKSLFYAATQLPHTQKEYLTSFVNVREQLATLSKTAQSISFKAFKDLCKAEGIEDVELMNDYARTFTLLGIALHFADDLQLKTHVFLRPKWIIDALFALLYAPSVENQLGRFSALDVEKIWTADDYDGMHALLLQLMEKFYLCYKIPHTADYIVPQRLPIREKAFLPPPDATHILYRYKFLPSGLLTQLTCRLHTRIEGEKVWNDAVQFQAKDSDGRVFVRENNADNSIELFGFGQHKADLINLVVDTIDEIHQNSKFGNLKVEKLVPCPCATCAAAREKKEDTMFFNYKFLIELLRDGETESDRCTLSRKKFPIKTILKHASIRLFKLEQIKELLEKDKVEKALDILRGQFGDDNDVINKVYRLARFNKDNSNGELTPAEANTQKNKLINDILMLLKNYEEEG